MHKSRHSKIHNNFKLTKTWRLLETSFAVILRKFSRIVHLDLYSVYLFFFFPTSLFCAPLLKLFQTITKYLPNIYPTSTEDLNLYRSSTQLLLYLDPTFCKTFVQIYSALLFWTEFLVLNFDTLSPKPFGNVYIKNCMNKKEF